MSFTEIFYFSGTGFTLHAAQKIAAQIPGEVHMTPIVAALNSKKRNCEAASVGFIFPMHAFTLPIICQTFLKEYKFEKAEYIFSLVTRGGAPTRIYKHIDAFLKKQGKRLNAFAYATTFNTFDIVYEVHTSDEMAAERSRFEGDIDEFAALVSRKEHFFNRGYRNRFMEMIGFPFIGWLNQLTGYFGLQNDIMADKSCNGCGLCQNMCLSGKIEMQNGKPVWKKDVQCVYCFACLNLCPQVAVQVRKSPTPDRERIFHPEVNWKDIAAQKDSKEDRAVSSQF